MAISSVDRGGLSKAMKQRPMVITLIACGLACGSGLHLGAWPQQTQTASGASNESADRDAMQKIRKAIVGDKNLSTYAHNVKIIAQNGKVTLRGPVRSETEKKAVADAATAVVGADNVTNELTIEPPKQ
jgi:osmotically-inducible protein OsmY